MKKMMISLLLVLLGALCIGGAGCAEGTLTVTLNDGAPIPYLDGTDSLMITDPEGLRGVTGAANATLEDITPGCTLTLQNISLTDDVLAVFFRVQSEALLNLWAGLTPDALSYAIPRLNCLMNGAYLAKVGLNQEAYLPDEENTLCCLAVYSLPEPLPDGAALDIGVGEKLLTVRIDRSRAQDPTVAYAPMQEETVCYVPYSESGREETCTLIIERIAFTPFGGRILMQMKQNQTSSFPLEDFTLYDDQGSRLPLFDQTYSYNSNASEEHPFWVRNEKWFAGGQDACALTIVPTVYGDSLDGKNNDLLVPIDSLPADVTLANGTQLRVLGFSADENGFIVPVMIKEGITYWLREFADAQGNDLSFNYISGQSAHRKTGVIQLEGAWSEFYKDRIVPMVTQEQIDEIRYLVFNTTNLNDYPLWEKAITVKLR